MQVNQHMQHYAAQEGKGEAVVLLASWTYADQDCEPSRGRPREEGPNRRLLRNATAPRPAKAVPRQGARALALAIGSGRTTYRRYRVRRPCVGGRESGPSCKHVKPHERGEWAREHSVLVPVCSVHVL